MNAFIVTACSKYIPEINALLGSFDYIGSKTDVHLWYYQYPDDYVEKLEKAEWSFKLYLHKIEEPEAREFGGVGEIVCRKRYWFAAEIGKSYDAVCVLDADMIFVRDPFQFFEIASKTGYILGVTKEQNKVYDHQHHTVNGEWMIPKGTWNDKDICNCPLFLDAKVWGDALMNSWLWFTDGFPETNMKAPDMDCLNIALLKAGAEDKIVKLPGLQWLGTNEQHLKPYVRVIKNRDDKLWTENGLEIFSFHGHYGHIKWRETQLLNRHNCAKNYLKCNLDDQAKGALDVLYNQFKKMFHWKIIPEVFNYRHPEVDYRAEYGDLWTKNF